MTTMTKAAEAEAAIAQVADLIDKLRGVIEQETALVHAGKVLTPARSRRKSRSVLACAYCVVPDPMTIEEALDEIVRLRSAVEAIRQATIGGRVCDDVAWFDTIKTLHDFCDQILTPHTS